MGEKPGRRETTTSPYPHACYGADRTGGVAGAEPPHKGGPNRPDRPNARRENRVNASLSGSLALLGKDSAVRMICAVGHIQRETLVWAL